jgi:hypothetical protein
MANMTDENPLADDATAGSVAKPRLRRELIIAATCLLIGLAILPALIYLVGTFLLGAYGGGPHIGSFFGDFFRNLLSGALRTWFIVLAPYFLLWLLRLIFWRWSGKKADDLPTDSAPHETRKRPESARGTANKERREPFVAQ